MKKLFLFFYCSALVLGAFGQNITLTPNTADIDGDPAVITEIHIDLHNAGDHQTMTWRRTVNDIHDKWTSSVCDFNLCWASTADFPGYYFEAPADTTGSVFVKFDARNYHDGAFDPVPGCGTVEVVFYSVTDSANYNALGAFHARLGVAEADCTTELISPSMDNSFLIYPNPAKNTLNALASFSANIQNIQIVNIVGKVTKEIKWNSTNGKMTFDISDLSQGIYFIRFNGPNNKVVYTEKISVIE